MSDQTKPLATRLKSLRVVLGIDSPETRGWAPLVQREARRVIDDCIAALAISPMTAGVDGVEPVAWRDVIAERRRQMESEGWTAEHDDHHPIGDFERAAATYLLYHLGVPGRATVEGLDAPCLWPWDRQWLKPKNTRRDLVRAAALTLAAIEKYDREWAERDRLQARIAAAARANEPAGSSARAGASGSDEIEFTGADFERRTDVSSILKGQS